MRKFLYFIALFFISQSLFSQNGTEPIKVTDMLKIKAIGAISLNKEGNKAIASVTGIEAEDNKWEYRYNNQLWLLSVDGSFAPRQLTFSKDGASQAVWHPNGRSIAFVRAVDGKPQIFLLSFEGGEPIQLTRYKYGASSPRWSDDGGEMLFTANIPMKDLLTDTSVNPLKEIPRWNFERPGFANNANLLSNSSKADPDGNLQEVRAYLDNNEKDKKAKVLTKLQFQEEATTSNELSFSHVFLVTAVPGAKPIQLTRGFTSFNNAQFIRSSYRILVEGDVNDEVHPDRTLGNQIYLVNKDGTDFKKLIGRNDYSFGGAIVSPSGRLIVLQHGPTGFISVPTLALLPLGGTEKDLINIPFDRNKNNISWSADENAIYFTAQSNGGSTFNKVDVATKKIESLTDVHSGVLNYSIQNNRLVYVKTEPTNPFEIYTSGIDAKNPTRISSFNVDWLKQKKLSLPEKHEFKNEKGLTIEYWVMKPLNYEPGKKFPVVLEIHGGPTAMWGPGETSMWHEFQFWTSKGYGVVYSNPRGSGGYGLNFVKSNMNDWGNGPMRDVLTALDKTVAEGWVDTSKLTVTGGSYAGYLIGYILGHDKRFKAACSQRGVYDLRTFFGEGNAWRLVPNYFGGYPWEKKVLEVLERESPISYVHNITTPYIMFHGENDLRTGVIQSEQMFKSLKVLGRPVEYVRHPGATHEITRSGNNRQRIDQMLRTWEFFERWVSSR